MNKNRFSSPEEAHGRLTQSWYLPERGRCDVSTRGLRSLFAALELELPQLGCALCLDAAYFKPTLCAGAMRVPLPSYGGWLCSSQNLSVLWDLARPPEVLWLLAGALQKYTWPYPVPAYLEGLFLLLPGLAGLRASLSWR